MKKILLVEDHPVMRAGVKQLLHSFLANVMVDEADNYKKVISAVTEEEYALVILDVDIPGGNSVRMVENIRNRRESQKILIYTSFDEDLYALSFIKSGANGFLSKHAPEGDFKQAVETILFQDKTYLSEKIKEQSFRMFIKSGKTVDDASDLLTLREREIMQLFLSGKGISEVAALLNLHTSTVSTHRIRIFNKMGVDNIIDLSRKFEMLK
jgi:two-component system invasion response regulator UvrY